MEFTSRIEVELKCPHCGLLYLNSVLLPCSHSVCLSCALSLQASSQNSIISNSSDISSPSSDVSITSSKNRPYDIMLSTDVSAASSRHMTSYVTSDFEDKSSVTSETDSGMDSGSRPNSYVGTPSIGNLSIQSTGSHEGTSYTLTCPRCTQVNLLEAEGVQALPRNVALEAIVQRYRESKSLPVLCQSCHGGPIHMEASLMTSSGLGGSLLTQSVKSADVMCEQCEIFYCYDCIEATSVDDHIGHTLLKLEEGCSTVLSKHRTRASLCGGGCESDEPCRMYCESCRTLVCHSCCVELHQGHNISQTPSVAKQHKTELSQQLHILSEKIKSGAEFVKKLKSVQDTIERNRAEMEALVTAECAALMECLERRKRSLLEELEREAQRKRNAYRDEIALCSGNVQRSTGLLQYSIELLKDPEPSAFLQTSSSMSQRVNDTIENWSKELQFETRVPPQFEWSFDVKDVKFCIETLSFREMRIPDAPTILVANSFADNNTISIAWADSDSLVGLASSSQRSRYGREYLLEIDVGMENKFKQVYRGREKICTVEGLHFDTDYRLRVKTVSGGGASPYSDVILLRTAREAYFTFDASCAQTNVLFSNDNMTVTSSSFDDRVVLGSVALSRGVHYWEISVDRFENNKDPAFGIAKSTVTKDRMLGRDPNRFCLLDRALVRKGYDDISRRGRATGKDDKGWSMYVDGSRSWFMHRGQHTNRTEGGIRVSSVVGVLLDLTRQCLRFYLNGEPHGPPTFLNLADDGPYYPAVSLNRNIQLTLHTGLSVPTDYESDGN